MKTAKDIMQFIKGDNAVNLRAAIHYRLTDAGAIEILRAYELNEPSDYEAYHTICHFDDGRRGHGFSDPRVRAAYLAWRKINSKKIVYCDCFMELMRAGFVNEQN